MIGHINLCTRLSPSVSISVCLPVCLCLSLFPPLCLSFSLSLPVCLSVCLPVSLCLSPSLFLTHSLSVSLFPPLRLSLFLCLSPPPPPHLSLHPLSVSNGIIDHPSPSDRSRIRSRRNTFVCVANAGSVFPSQVTPGSRSLSLCQSAKGNVSIDSSSSQSSCRDH